MFIYYSLLGRLFGQPVEQSVISFGQRFLKASRLKDHDQDKNRSENDQVQAR
jgi:hypothetical protein